MLARSIFAVLLLCALPVRGEGRIEMFYLYAPDCPYCAHWEARARGELLASPEGQAVRYVEVRGETLRQPIVARHYAPEFQWVYQQIGPSRGVPRFLLAIDGRITVSAYGTGGYSQVFLPALRAAVANRAAAQPRAGYSKGGTHERHDPS